MQICECEVPDVTTPEGKDPHCERCGHWYVPQQGSKPKPVDLVAQELPEGHHRPRTLHELARLKERWLKAEDRSKSKGDGPSPFEERRQKALAAIDLEIMRRTVPNLKAFPKKKQRQLGLLPALA
jgi:hypothetical protein